MECSYKFRIYPNEAQAEQIQRTFGCARFVYNYYLAKRKEVYEQTGETFNYFACSKDLTVLKHSQDMHWLCEIDSQALTSSLRDLDMAYKNFFHSLKRGGGVGFPKFKSKRDNHQSYRTNKIQENIKVLDKAVQLPKLGKVECRVNREVKGRILNATVSQTPSGKYFVSICCTEVEIEPLERTGAVCGVKLGVRELAVTSDGERFENNKYLSQAEKKLARLQRQLSRKSKGSNNRNKARIKVARLQEHIANQRKDAIHKVTTKLVRDCDVICIEDLSAKDMMHNSYYAKSVADASLGEFRRQLEYKANWYGRTISVTERFYPAIQTCSCCGAQYDDVKKSAARHWTCPSCGVKLDRSVNAAINIRNEGLRLLA